MPTIDTKRLRKAEQQYRRTILRGLRTSNWTVDYCEGGVWGDITRNQMEQLIADGLVEVVKTVQVERVTYRLVQKDA